MRRKDVGNTGECALDLAKPIAYLWESCDILTALGVPLSLCAGVAEQVDAVDSKSTGTWYCAGSSPAPGTKDEKASRNLCLSP